MLISFRTTAYVQANIFLAAPCQTPKEDFQRANSFQEFIEEASSQILTPTTSAHILTIARSCKPCCRGSERSVVDQTPGTSSHASEADNGPSAGGRSDADPAPAVAAPAVAAPAVAAPANPPPTPRPRRSTPPRRPRLRRAREAAKAPEPNNSSCA